MPDSGQWFVVPVNPYPWKVPPMSVGRAKGGKLFVRAGRDEGLYTYQQAVKEHLIAQGAEKIEGPVRLEMYFWRNMAEYTTWQGRRARKNEVDTTNLQKATEDACQGILFDNDKDNIQVYSHRVSQGPDTSSCVVIRAAPATEAPPALPPRVEEALNAVLDGTGLGAGPPQKFWDVP